MARAQQRSRRKVTGTKYTPARKKKLYEIGGEPTLTQIGKERLKLKRVTGGNSKKSLLKTEVVYVTEKNKTSKIKVTGVKENPANKNYTRRNVITKGAIVTTDKGDVKITSRPGQNGTLFGVFQK